MFYSFNVLAKKGPLAKVWLAAHNMDKKLTKQVIFQTDVVALVDQVANPQAPLALRTSSHLLLGIARIYSRKVKYLMEDCSDAMTKIKMAFRPTAVDLPTEAKQAAFNAITIVQHEHDLPLPDTQSSFNSINASKPEITVRNIHHMVDDSLMDPQNFPFEAENLWDIVIPRSSVERSVEPTNVSDIEVRRGELPRPSPLQIPRAESEDYVHGGGFDPQDWPISFPENENLPTPLPTPATKDVRQWTPLAADVSLLSKLTPSAGPATFAVPAPKQPRQQKRKAVPVDETTELSRDHMSKLQKNADRLVRDIDFVPSTRAELDAQFMARNVENMVLNQPIMRGLNAQLTKYLQHALSKRSAGPPPEERSAKKAKDVTPLSDYANDVPVDLPGRWTPEPGNVEPYEDNTNIAPTPTAAKAAAPVPLFSNSEPSSNSHSAALQAKHTEQMIQVLKGEFGTKKTVSLNALVKGHTRKVAAQTFFEVLVLKSRSLIDVKQDAPYKDIKLTATKLLAA
eukprot:TRINITY_DN1678_c0_g1_i2.p1 TRINITY_DN1678_c0_g1~~TRINITY_DN1678_c0_g1_i2.p1  ORF type:complete len:511 (+),score=118.29 TRINITY_DN1678_c0_g1_i2:72-1604(+)